MQAACRIKELEASLAKTRAELSKWQRPYDQARFDAARQQASHKDSLAAMQVYIIALEHGFKVVEDERDALKAMCGELADALQWYHGGEPLPTLANAALTKWQTMKEKKWAIT